MATTTEVRNALHEVIDPELGLNIVDLGMVRKIEREGGRVVVHMILTTVSCPFWELFVDQVRTALDDVRGVEEVEVKLDARRVWSPELLSDSARGELEIMGLLPTTTWLN